MNKSELLLSGKLLNRILPFHRFLLRVILLKIHQLHRAAVLRILGTFPTVMCLQPFLKIIRPDSIQSFITAFYNVCLSVSFIIFYQLSLFYCFLFYFSIVLSFCLFYDFLLQFINSNFLLFPATTFYRKHFII